jgi:hypothetical protein
MPRQCLWQAVGIKIAQINATDSDPAAKMTLGDAVLIAETWRQQHDTFIANT